MKREKNMKIMPIMQTSVCKKNVNFSSRLDKYNELAKKLGSEYSVRLIHSDANPGFRIGDPSTVREVYEVCKHGVPCGHGQIIETAGRGVTYQVDGMGQVGKLIKDSDNSEHWYY